MPCAVWHRSWGFWTHQELHYQDCREDWRGSLLSAMMSSWEGQGQPHWHHHTKSWIRAEFGHSFKRPTHPGVYDEKLDGVKITCCLEGESRTQGQDPRLEPVLSVWGEHFFFYFNFYAWFGMLLKGVGESFILSEDEPLTPNIDGVMALWIFRRRAQTAKKWQKLDL